MSLTVDRLGREYFAKQDAYRRLFNEVWADRVAHEIALREALDALVDASMRFEEARKAERADLSHAIACAEDAATLKAAE